MVRTIIHRARMGGGGDVLMGFSIPVAVSNFHLIEEGGGGGKVDRGCWFYRHAMKFFW